MTYFDYKAVPAPKRARKIKGVKGAPDLFAMTLTDAINEVARQGWEYVRAESMPSETSGGLFRRSVEAEHTMLIFRRPREHLSPRLEAGSGQGEQETNAAPAVSAPPANSPPPLETRIQSGVLREPAREEETVTPLRASPRLGHAEHS